jgi:hypothetical protein
MGKWITGGSAALALWLGSAMVANAQGINVTTTGPTAVACSQNECTATATVSGTSSYLYYVSIRINGVLKYNRSFYGTGSNISRLVSGMSLWGMQPGDTFETKVSISVYNSALPITVGESFTQVQPATRRPSQVPAAIKEEQLCLLGSTEEAAA